MDPQSPPKRITRARAAAKATQPQVLKPTRVVTAAAAAKARAIVTAKRKTRSEDVEDDDDQDELGGPEPAILSSTAPTKAARAPRGRPKKTAEVPESKAMDGEALPAPARAPRGRPKKVISEPAQGPPTKPTRASRAKKVEEDTATAPPPEQEPSTKKTTRSRSTAAPKQPAKKTVKFEEPEKENIMPSTGRPGKALSKPAESSGVGLRARPVRKPVTGSRTTRAAARAAPSAEKEAKPTPLSPKKITQVAVHRDVESDDELAMTGQTPMKPLMKSPVKPAHSIPSHDVPQQPSLRTASIMLGTPARRPPPPPFKDALKSPPKRVEGTSALNKATASAALNPAQPKLNTSLFASPAKRPPPAINLFRQQDDTISSPLKMSLLGSPAKRLPVPVKDFGVSLPEEPARGLLSPTTKPTLLASPSRTEPTTSQPALELRAATDNSSTTTQPAKLRFPGRLSAVLPRDADPALKAETLGMPEMVEEEISTETVQDTIESHEADFSADPMVLDEPEIEATVRSRASTTPPCSPPMRPVDALGLREKDLDPYYGQESESEDELTTRGNASNFSAAVPSTPCPIVRARNPAVDSTQVSHGNNLTLGLDFGFTPLAKQLDGWSAGSPPETEHHEANPELKQARIAAENPPAYDIALQPPPAEPTVCNAFFEDAMLAHDGHVPQLDEPTCAEPQHQVSEVADFIFDDVPITDEDIALAEEAREMSLMEPDQVDELVHAEAQDDSISEASQEYGDENAIPIDPAILNDGQGLSMAAPPPVTPQRIVTRTFHTVSKVPLKPADESTPMPKTRRRSLSVSRLPVHRLRRPSSRLTRNATVISYSPMKRRDDTMASQPAEETGDEMERAGSEPPATPSKPEAAWSNAGTPARTPRRDVNPALLRGAVVFVDVHTSEGADASGIFVELLTQMGARCVKSWPWNPSSPPGAATPSSSRVGITHVVYKDGGKRTLEKVRESAGVVQCVGVSWVLDCERANEWLEEAPYYIDTSFVPRGGARRRKSMEPKALANLNGMLVPTPAKGATTARDCQSAPNTPANRRRRESGLWVITPEDDKDGAKSGSGNDDSLWAGGMLTPVPMTPAPEAIARFAEAVTPETPSAVSEAGGALLSAAEREDLLMQTCPAKASVYHELGDGVLSREKDESVLMRLMAARRKSLQFAPKVGSPLAKTWE